MDGQAQIAFKCGMPRRHPGAALIGAGVIADDGLTRQKHRTQQGVQVVKDHSLLGMLRIVGARSGIPADVGHGMHAQEWLPLGLVLHLPHQPERAAGERHQFLQHRVKRGARRRAGNEDGLGLCDGLQQAVLACQHGLGALARPGARAAFQHRLNLRRKRQQMVPLRGLHEKVTEAMPHGVCRLRLFSLRHDEQGGHVVKQFKHVKGSAIHHAPHRQHHIGLLAGQHRAGVGQRRRHLDRPVQPGIDQRTHHCLRVGTIIIDQED